MGRRWWGPGARHSVHLLEAPHGVHRGAVEHAVDRLTAEGAAMSMEEAIAYARRGRGERKRPSAGWASLTPTEVQVVELVAEGLSNPQIAERMFVSKRTVSTHVTHIFTKLAIASRSELAARATERRVRE